MTEVKRYDIKLDADGLCREIEAPDGVYVEAEDHQAEVERLRAAATALLDLHMRALSGDVAGNTEWDGAVGALRAVLAPLAAKKKEARDE
jgi:hypothetical protein